MLGPKNLFYFPTPFAVDQALREIQLGLWATPRNTPILTAESCSGIEIASRSRMVIEYNGINVNNVKNRPSKNQIAFLGNFKWTSPSRWTASGITFLDSSVINFSGFLGNRIAWWSKQRRFVCIQRWIGGVITSNQGRLEHRKRMR